METAEILERIGTFSGRFEREAVEAAVARREEVTPGLLRLLEQAIQWAEDPGDAEIDGMAHIYAMFLLGQFRETRAYPQVVRFAALPPDSLEYLGGDFVTENLGPVLASVCGGDLSGIKSLVENDDVDEYARSAALEALVALVAAGVKTREEIVEYFAELYRGKLTREPSHVWDSLAVGCADLGAVELAADVDRSYQEDLVDPGFAGWAEIERDFEGGVDHALAKLAEGSHNRLIGDTVQEMEWWACFEENKERHGSTLAEDAGSDLDYVSDGRIPYRRETPKMGRNEPCPCGSGKKYKKCCGG